MITMTDQAGIVLRRSMSPQEAAGGVSFRFSEQESGEVALVKGEHQDGDVELEYGGQTVLRIPGNIADQLDNGTVDVAASEDGRSLRLVIRSPG